ncbi:MAG TPA: TonB-dependent receptor plug domain-containing protein, partial [Dyella sp.]|uniref:TonB-dependent receptor plug domain-containing protein n=1 Tax=Dyella sp. TaxID=1869338 RepID=UPI002C5FCF6A
MKDLRHKSLCLLICASLAGSIGHAGAVAAQTASTDVQSAPAADAQQKSLQVIQVTGSLIRSVDIEQAQPVVTLSAQDIQQQGFATLGQLLQNLTSTSTPDISKSNPSDAGTDAGGSFVDLRGLGSTRTLILIDGKRVGSSYTGMTNLDTIPVSIIDHVDILADGASAVYGSDAIGGVINVITKKDFNGAQIDAYEGKYMPHGDGTQGQYGVTFGKSTPRGSILFSAQYQNQDGISANRRPYSAYPLTDRFPLNGLGSGAYGTFVNADGGLSVLNAGGDPRNINDYHAQVAPTTAANGVVTNAGDTYNYSNQTSLLSATTMKNLFLQGQYNITDNVSAHFNAAFNQDNNTSELGGFPLASTNITSSVPQY